MTRETIFEEVQKILKVLDERRKLGRPSYLTSVRKAVQSAISLRLSEYVTFLDHHGLVKFDRKRNTLELLDKGDTALAGTNRDEILDLISEHFTSVLPQDEALESAPESAPAPEPTPPPVSRPEPTGGYRAARPEPASRSYGSMSEPPATRAIPKASEPRRPTPAPEPRRVTPAPEPRRVTPPPEPPASEPRHAPPLVRHEAPAPRDLAKSLYDLGEVIGAGGLGNVYRSRQLHLDRDVAIKEIKTLFDYFPSSQRQSLLDSIKEVVSANAGLSHPFIVHVLDLCLDRDHPLIVEEFCEGGSLRDRLKDQGRLEPKQAVQIFVQVAEAVAHAHRNGVVHRNLKPENILFDGFGNAKVSDFGMAGIAGREERGGQQFYMGMTVAYLSPEQFQDARNVSEQSDIYSLGIILYEMLTGKLPGRRSKMPSECFADIPPDLDDIFDKMTMDYLDERYASLDDVLMDLYRSRGILGLLLHRGPALYTATDLSGLPPLEQMFAQPRRQAPAPAKPVIREPAPAPAQAPTPGPMSREQAPRPQRRSSRLIDRLGDDLFGD